VVNITAGAGFSFYGCGQLTHSGLHASNVRGLRLTTFQPPTPQQRPTLTLMFSLLISRQKATNSRLDTPFK